MRARTLIRKSGPILSDSFLKIDAFRNYSDKCLAGEDRNFINRYISKTFKAKTLPLSYEQGFLA